MCGIFGLIQAKPFDAAELLNMSQVIRHRGPDDEGFALFDGENAPLLFGGADTPISSMGNLGIPWLPQQRLSLQMQIKQGGARSWA